MKKIEFLKGMLAGMDMDPASKEGKLFYALCDALEEMAAYTEELEDRIMELEELCDILDEDLGDIEELLLDDEDDDACDDCSGCCCGEDLAEEEDEEEYSTVCPTCGKFLVLSEQTLEEGEMICPFCGQEMDFNLEGLDIEALDTAIISTDEDPNV